MVASAQDIDDGRLSTRIGPVQTIQQGLIRLVVAQHLQRLLRRTFFAIRTLYYASEKNVNVLCISQRLERFQGGRAHSFVRVGHRPDHRRASREGPAGRCRCLMLHQLDMRAQPHVP